VLSSLSLLGETSLELTGTGGNHEDGGVSLGCSGNHVLDEITMAGGINNGEDSLGGLEFPKGNVDGDTTIALSLQLVEYPSVLEGSLTSFVGLLFEALDGTGVNSTAFVDQMTGGGGFAGIDMTDDDNVNLILLFRFLP